MRIICTILSIFFCYNSYGQFYLDSLVLKSLDTHYHRAGKYYSQSENKKALLSYDSLELKWQKVLNTQSDEKLYQNYYYIKVKQIQTKIKLRALTPEVINEFINLENSLTQKLPENNIVLAAYYSVVAELQIDQLSDLKKSIDYSNKCIKISSQHGDKFLNLIAREYICIGYAYKSVFDYENTEKFFLKSIEVRERINPIPKKSILNSKYSLASVYRNQGKHKEALELAIETVEQATQILKKNHNLIYSALDLIAMTYNEMGDSKKALEYSFAALNVLRDEKGDVSLKGDSQYNRISTLYERMGKYKLSQVYIDSAFNIVKKSGRSDKIAIVYNSKAMSAQNVNDQLLYLENAINYCNKNAWCKGVNLPIFLSNVGIVYSKKGDTKTALNYLLKSKNIKENNLDRLGYSLANTYSHIASNYDKIGLLVKADYYHNKAITSALKYKGNDTHFITTQYISYGNFLLDNIDYDKAGKYFEMTAEILKKDSSLNIRAFVDNNESLSRLYYEKGDYEKSLEHALDSYSIASSDSKYNLISKAPIIKQLFKVNQKIGRLDSCQKLVNELLEMSGFMLYEKAVPENINPPNGNYYEAYINFFTHLKLESILSNNQSLFIEKISYGLQLIKKLRSEVFYETSEKELQSEVRAFYNWSINKLATQYKLTNDPKYLTLLYECIERSKSLILDRQQIREAALSKTNLPLVVLDQEKDILYSYEENYNKFINQSEVSDSIKEINQQNLYRIQKRKESFIDSLKQDYPDYYNSRYDQKVTTLQECQQITAEEDRTFIIYHWGDSILHKLIIDKEGIDYSDIDISDIENQLLKIEQLVKTPMSELSEADYVDEKREFIKLSRALFVQLIGDTYINPTSLTIIPDNKLVHLPFGILLYDNVDGTADYRSLPYLMTKSSINYCGSMSHYQTLTEHRGYKSNQNYIGFAPSYTTVVDPDSMDMLVTRSDISSSQLLYNISEVLKSSELLDGEHYIAEDATELQFKANASNSHILHLAMHTKVISNQPYDTYLQFEPSIESEEDGRLHLDEIARIELNNNLVILSACETNVGENIVGESILGIARAFQLASCPNIVLTNWLIDDKSSSSIIPDFLRGINEEHPPAVSLQNAKLNYLNNCSEVQAHPYFWSGYSYYGATQIKSSSDNLLRNLLLSASILIAILFFFNLYRKKSKDI